MSEQLPLFQQPPQPEELGNQPCSRRAADDALPWVLSRLACTRTGYNRARSGRSDRYLQKWTPEAGADYEMGRLLACELAAEFGAAPDWPATASGGVLSALINWRAAHPGEKIEP